MKQNRMYLAWLLDLSEVHGRIEFVTLKNKMAWGTYRTENEFTEELIMALMLEAVRGNHEK